MSEDVAKRPTTMKELVDRVLGVIEMDAEAPDATEIQARQALVQTSLLAVIPELLERVPTMKDRDLISFNKQLLENGLKLHALSRKMAAAENAKDGEIPAKIVVLPD